MERIFFAASVHWVPTYQGYMKYLVIWTDVLSLQKNIVDSKQVDFRMKSISEIMTIL